MAKAKKAPKNYDHIYLTNDEDLGAVASAIRTKGGTEEALEFPDGFVTAIQAIPSGGGGAHFKYGTFTAASSSGKQVILSEDADVIAHYNDPNLVLILIDTDVTPRDTDWRGICSVRSNSQIFNAKYGYFVTSKGTSPYSRIADISYNAYSGGYGLRVNAEGELFIQGGSSSFVTSPHTYAYIMIW